MTPSRSTTLHGRALPSKVAGEHKLDSMSCCYSCCCLMQKMKISWVGREKKVERLDLGGNRGDYGQNTMLEVL